ncbi:hypothetical protein OPT61_g4587 [Boeremia exigua]|uniref:Uncharacterized protein n=1 Tax=Boeremia exigua TaxID=749465 RepID=A0ACC2IDL0_9PLEO|nr:hypothetical protein OPT61_g4587 [Boeremia exigua]
MAARKPEVQSRRAAYQLMQDRKELALTSVSWQTTFADLVGSMYDAKPGLIADQELGIKLPDQPVTDRPDTFELYLRQWRSYNSFVRQVSPPNDLQPPLSIAECSRILNTLVTDPKNDIQFPFTINRLMTVKQIEEKSICAARQQGAALVAQQIMRCNDKIAEVIPIRFNVPSRKVHDTSSNTDGESQAGAPEHLALLIKMTDGTTTLLPLCMDIIGRRKRPYVHIKPESGDPWEYTSWSWKCGAVPLLQKFKGFPLLTVTDDFFLQPTCILRPDAKKHPEANTWWTGKEYAPRILSTTWAIRCISPDARVLPPSMSAWRPLGPGGTPSVFEFNTVTGDLFRFTSVQSAVDEVLQYGHTVTVENDILPFQIVTLNNIAVSPSQTAVIHIHTNPQTLVDGEISCSYHYSCTATDIDQELGLCKVHSARLIEYLCSNPLLSDITADLPLLSELSWGLPQRKETRANFIDALRLLHEHDNDAVFCGMLKQSTKETYTSYIKYHYSSLGDHVDALQEEGVMNYKDGWTESVINNQMCTFWEAYDPLHTKARPPFAQLQGLRDIGFDEDTALFVNWGCSKIDRTSLGRILRQRDELAVPQDEVYPRAKLLDLDSFFKQGLGLTKWSLSTVYAMYFPRMKDRQVLSFHDAMFDTRVLSELLERAREDTKELYTECMRTGFKA